MLRRTQAVFAPTVHTPRSGANGARLLLASAAIPQPQRHSVATQQPYAAAERDRRAARRPCAPLAAGGHTLMRADRPHGPATTPAEPGAVWGVPTRPRSE